MATDEFADDLSGNEIAIIGMALRAPGARDYHEFWRNLQQGVESISFLSEDELIASGVPASQYRQKNFVAVKGGVLDDAEAFDAELFGYNTVDAQTMEPQMRVFHECIWAALDDAGYDPARYAGAIGLYAGAPVNYPWAVRMIAEDRREILQPQVFNMQVNKDFLATRLSHRLNLRGPSLSIQTTCSTSLVAVHLACQALLEGECDMALAGGVSLLNGAGNGYLHGVDMPLSADGHVRAFDADASGVTFSEGAGAVLLKMYSDALADGDHIVAVIKGSAINNDGADKAGYAAPSVGGQKSVIQSALNVAGVDPHTIGYVEAHGTGTKIGDPIEMRALTQAFDAARVADAQQRRQYCALGSVKTNIGHLNAAAGVAGLIKTALLLKHGKLVPSLHYNAPNPAIDFGNSPFYVNTQCRDWPAQNFPRRAGVSSFGIGGTNAHVVLEQHRVDARVTAGDEAAAGPRLHIVALSAQHPAGLEAIRANLAQHLTKETPSLQDLAFTLAQGRKPLKYRQHFVADSIEALRQALNDDAEYFTVTPSLRNRPLVLVFSGQGAAADNLAATLHDNIPAFRDELSACFDLVKKLYGYDLHAQMTNAAQDGSEEERLITMGVMKFSIEYSLARYLLQLGVKPAAMIGYSLGEYVAACLAGVMSLEDALRITVARNLVYYHHVEEGGMLLVPLPEQELVPLLDERLSLAAVNTPANCTVAGTRDAISELKKRLRKEHGCPAIVLPVKRAGHSWMIDGALDAFFEHIQNIRFSPAKTRYISSLTGTWIDPQQVATPQYWLRHLRHTVRFGDAMTTACEIPGAVFVQPGIDQSVVAFAREYCGKNQLALNLLAASTEKTSEQHFLFERLGRLWSLGVPVALESVIGTAQRLPLPTYPFHRGNHRRNHSGSDKPVTLMQQFSERLQRMPQPLPKSVFHPSWQRYEQSHAAMATYDDVLVFVEAGDAVGASLVAALAAKSRRVVSVHVAQDYSRRDSDTFAIRPDQPQDYENLLRDLGAQQFSLRKIVHAWCLQPLPASDSVARVQQALHIGFYSLLNLARAVALLEPAENAAQGIQIVAMTNNLFDVIGGENRQPEYATLTGVANTIAVDIDNVSCRIVDVDRQGTTDVVAVASWAEAVLWDCSEPVLALRNRRSWQQVFAAVNEVDVARRLQFRDGAVYLLAGGLGRLGLVLAAHIAAKVRCTLVLMGRSLFPARDNWQQIENDPGTEETLRQTLARLRAIEESGSRIVIAQADIADAQQLEHALARVAQQHGAINGVIHCTRFTDTHPMIPLRTVQQTEAAFAGKIYGLLNLHGVLQREPSLDFFLCCSSLAAFLPVVGSAGYIAANAFMDAFASYWRQQHDQRIFSINWAHFLFSQDQHSLADYCLDTDDVSAILDNYLTDDCRQLVVSRAPVDVLRRFIADNTRNYLQSMAARSAADEDDDGNLRDRLSSSYAHAATATERELLGIWSGIFRLDELGVEDNFLELGGDSLKAIFMLAKVREKFQVRLSIAVLLGSPTIRALAAHIDNLDKSDRIGEVLHRLTEGEMPLSIVAIPYAGGSLYAYNKLALEIGKARDPYTLYALQIPGNELGDLPQDKLSIPDLATRCVAEMRDKISGPFAIYAHCGGSVLALEIVRQLQLEQRLPQCVIYGALTLPKHYLRNHDDVALPNVDPQSLHERFDLIEGFGGRSRDMPKEEYEFIAANLIRDSEQLHAYLSDALKGEKRGLLAEVSALVRSKPVDSLYPVPLINIVAKDDPVTADYKKSYKNWSRFYSSVELMEIDSGGHYFVDTRVEEVAGIIRTVLARGVG